MADNTTIQIALPSDQNYFHGLMVTATSIVLYANPVSPLRFHVLDGGLADESFDRLERHVRGLRPNVSVVRHRIDTGLFDRFPAWSRNRMTYARLLLPELLPDADHVIYTDTDVLWLAAVDDLWAKADDRTPAWTVRDGVAETRDRENAWFDAHGLACPGDDYFCAGVMLFNLRRFREDQITEQAFAFVERHPGLLFADQTAMNHLLYRQVGLLPEPWQTLTLNLKPEALGAPVVLHYANEIPWKRTTRWGLLSDSVMIWHGFNDRFVLRRPGASLKRFYPLRERILKRLLYKLLLWRLPRALCFWMLAGMRRDDIIASLSPYLHALGRRRLAALRAEWERRATALAGLHQNDACV
jgi:lipopolysaccharide biosynthesis glycosyltransferase